MTVMMVIRPAPVPGLLRPLLAVLAQPGAGAGCAGWNGGPVAQRVLERYPAHRESLVPGAGLEPARPCGQRILSPLRLPIPPPGCGAGRPSQHSNGAGGSGGKMEAGVGIEPAYTALQAAA